MAIFAETVPDAQISLAENLRALGRSERAAVEFLRFSHYYPDDARADLSKFQAAICFEDVREFSPARTLYRELIRDNAPDSIRDAALFRLPLTYHKSGQLNRCVEIASEFEDSCSNECQLSLVYLEGWSYFLGRQYLKADEFFRRLDEADFDSSTGFMLEMSKCGTELRRKSPFLAASMSAVIPGAGRAYLGRWGDAIVGFIAVGGSAAGGYALLDEDRGFAVSLLITSAVLYGANIYGSYVGGRYYNEEQHRELYRYVKERSPRRPEELYRF
jgi:tetratricopeptide (TPR) repeat protein